LTGFVILQEAGYGLLLLAAVNVVGVALLGLVAWKLAQLKRRRSQATSQDDAARWSPLNARVRSSL
jgi:Tfp pilus assembly protein PilX